MSIVLRELEQEQLIVRAKRFIRIPNWPAMRQAAGFRELYLHLEQANAGGSPLSNVAANRGHEAMPAR